MTGKFTRYPTRVGDRDYAICSTNIMDCIFSFTVSPFSGLSDHCCISTCIRVNVINEEHDGQYESKEHEVHIDELKYTYNINERDKFETHQFKSKINKLHEVL